MTMALTTTSPPAIIQVLPDQASMIRLPNGDVVHGARPGWSGEGYLLVMIIPFVTPDGMQNIGGPTYSIVNGNVVETYATGIIPAAIPTITSLQYFSLFTQAEQVAIATAAETDPNMALLVSDSAAAGVLQLNDPRVSVGLMYMVSKNIITAARMAAILAGMPPQ